MSGTAVQDSSSKPSVLSDSEDPYVHAAVVACGGSDLVDVGQVDYIAWQSGRNTEECVREALEAGEIEPFHKDRDGYRKFDIYRVTPKGLREHRRHMRWVRREAAWFIEVTKENKAYFDALAAEAERLRQTAGGDAAAQAGLAPARDSSSEPPALVDDDEEPYVHAAVVACGGCDNVDVGQIDYVARRSGYDTEECVREAVEAGEIEPLHKDKDGYRQFDIYSVTPKGLEEHRRHMRRVRREAAWFADATKENKAYFDALAAEAEQLRQSAGGDAAAQAKCASARDSSSEPPALVDDDEEPYVHDAVVACGGSDLVDVGQIDNVARRSGYDTEECVRVAVEAGEIEPFHKSEDGSRQFDIYRVTPKGLKEHRRHMRRVRREAEELAPWFRDVDAEFAAMDAEEERLRQSAGGDAAAQAGRAPA